MTYICSILRSCGRLLVFFLLLLRVDRCDDRLSRIPNESSSSRGNENGRTGRTRHNKGNSKSTWNCSLVRTQVCVTVAITVPSTSTPVDRSPSDRKESDACSN